MAASGEISFPDAQRGELDHALDNLVARANDVLKVQGRLRSLLRANQAIIENLEISVVLERIVQVAVDLVGARYGALGVVAPDGSLEKFITVGMSDHDIEQIGDSPEGHGLLGVPIRVRDDVYGNLYLGNQADDQFTEDDQQLVTSLAATAGVAIENARLFAETRRRQAWSSASEEFTAILMSSDQDNAIATLATRILGLSESDIVWILVPTDDEEYLLAEIARGLDAEEIEGTTVATKGSILASVLEAKQPRQIDDGSRTELGLRGGKILGPVMAVPLIVAGLTQGALMVGRLKGGMRFSPEELEMAAHFAGQASIAMELAAARGVQQRMELLEERGRIARDLHDHVIQQLFGNGLELQSVAGALGSLPPKVAADRIVKSVQNLDASISQIRTVVFALSVQTDDSRNTVRHCIIDLATQLTPALGSAPQVTFVGPVDLIITDEMAADVVAVTREALVNVIKHAGAEHTSVTLTAAGGSVDLAISDDGRGFDGSGRRSGVANLEARAIERGGTLVVDSDATGTRLLWTVPYAELVT